MATAFVDIKTEVKGLSDVQKLEKRMEALEKEVTRLQKGLPKATNNVRKFGGAARGASGGVKALGAAVKTALGPLVAVAAAVGSLTAAFRTVAGQDFALAKVRSLGVDSDVLAAALKDVSAELKGNASVAELTAAAYDVASAGFTNAADAALVLKAASLGATGGFSDINTVADAATSVLNAYGKSAADAGRLIDGFIQTQNDGKIVVDDYARNIGKVASAAAGLKIPIEEVNTVIAQSTAAGVQSEIAFTGLKGALARLASGEAAKALSDFGIEIDAASIEADGLIGTLKKLEGLDTGTLLKALGTEAGPALLPVIQNLEKTEKLLENQKNAAGAASRAQQEAANTINGAWNRVLVSITNLFSDQAALAQAIIPILDAVASAVDGITTATEGFKKVAVAVNGTINSLGEKLNGLSSFFGTLGESIKWAADQLGRLLLRADGFNDPGVQELMRTRVYDNSQGAGFDIEAIKKMSAAAAAAKKTTKTTPVPEFKPILSGGGGADKAAAEAQKLADKTAERLLAAEKLVAAAQQEGELIAATTDLEKAQVESMNRMMGIADKYAELAKGILSDAERENLLKAQGLEIQNERKTLDEQIAEIQGGAVSSIQDEIDLLQAKIEGKEDEYKITKAIKDLEAGGKVSNAEATALVNQREQLKQTVKGMEEAEAAAESLSGSIASSLTNSLMGLIDGSMSAEEALSSAFKSIASSFMDMAAEMIQEWLKMQIMGLVKGMFGSGAQGMAANGAGAFFNATGGVIPPNSMSVVGEQGPELVSTGSSPMRVTNASQTDALAKYSPGGGGGGNSQPVTVNYNGPQLTFDGNQYISRDALPEIISTAAKKGAKLGEANTFKAMRNRRSTRQSIGI